MYNWLSNDSLLTVFEKNKNIRSYFVAIIL